MILLLWDFDSTWSTKMHVTCSILEIKISNFGIKLVFMKQKICVLKSKLKNHFFNPPLFLAPPSPATRVKAKTQKYISKYLYLIFRKSQEVSNQYLYRFMSSIICKKRLGAKRPPPPTKDRVKRWTFSGVGGWLGGKVGGQLARESCNEAN